MSGNKWDEFGGGIDDVIQKAIDSGNYNSLGNDVNDIIRKAAYTFENAINKGLNEARNKTVKTNLGGNTVEINKNYQDRIKRPVNKSEIVSSDKKLYISDNQLFGKGMASAIIGGFFTFSLGIGILALAAEGNFFSGVVVSPLFIPSLLLFLNGVKTLKERLIFKNYQKVLAVSDSKSFAKIEELMHETGESKKTTLKRLKKMIRKRWFKEGHIDKTETTFISTNETYALYQKTQLEFEKRQRIEEELGRFKEENTKKVEIEAEVQEIINQGKKYLAQISHLNDRIPGVEVSDKIFKIEDLTGRILRRVEEHPSSADDIKQLMKYYLPMTIKLLTAYAEMDEQQVKADNIDKSKREIENVLDSLNDAFNKLLDDLYKDTAWDISSDVSVLNAMLKREGLRGNDFNNENSGGGSGNNEDGIKLTL
ncbi:MAG: 5-bromo-4-chloroindolyl phosphate hydrolysis family protein [Catonella sp.]|uniref:5-bromo-4-chloroindolyl phosphate hydrolysis family protein n=1 Tax=Catonella sp. TaxID=2382125 RepID=UPI003F9F53E4